MPQLPHSIKLPAVSLLLIDLLLRLLAFEVLYLGTAIYLPLNLLIVKRHYSIDLRLSSTSAINRQGRHVIFYFLHDGFQSDSQAFGYLNFFFRACSTHGGTRPFTLPCILASSLTLEERITKYLGSVGMNIISISG